MKPLKVISGERCRIYRSIAQTHLFTRVLKLFIVELIQSALHKSLSIEWYILELYLFHCLWYILVQQDGPLCTADREAFTVDNVIFT